MPERDEHYWKYRVFHEPMINDEDISHPVKVDAKFLSEEDSEFEVWDELREVDGTFFVLRPEGDKHARVALATYAYSVASEFPNLAKDILMILGEIDWEEQTGQNKGDFPLSKNNLNVHGEDFPDNIIELIRNRGKDVS